MTSRNALILVGGFGTRLGNLTKNTPKPLLTVGGAPFLLHLLSYLERQNFSRVVLATHFQMDQFVEFQTKFTFDALSVDIVFEREPRGTAGAVVNAAVKMPEEFYVLNGDTFSETNFCHMEKRFYQHACPIIIGLKRASNFPNRYGSVQLSPDGLVVDFLEKASTLSESSTLNTGVYLVKRDFFLTLPNQRASLEWDVFPFLVKRRRLAGVVLEGKFLDIGTPESLLEAKSFFDSWSNL